MMEKQLKIFSVAHLGSFYMKRIRVLTPPSPLNKMLDHCTLHLNISSIRSYPVILLENATASGNIPPKKQHNDPVRSQTQTSRVHCAFAWAPRLP